MIEYTVHFQKGTRVGSRSLRMITLMAASVKEAIKDAKKKLSLEPGYKLTRIDHFEDGKIVVDQ